MLSKGGENDRLVARRYYQYYSSHSSCAPSRCNPPRQASSCSLRSTTYSFFMISPSARFVPEEDHPHSLLHCAERCTSSCPHTQRDLRTPGGESPSGGPARLGLALRKTYAATGQPRALICVRPLCSAISPMRAVPQVGAARRGKGGCRVVSKRSTGCMRPPRARARMAGADPGTLLRALTRSTARSRGVTKGGRWPSP